MEKEEFIRQYVVTFLASYAAEQYDFNCQTGWKNRDQPIEDAYCLAEEAWEQLKATME